MDYVQMPDGDRVPADWLREVWWTEAQCERLCACYPEDLSVDELLARCPRVDDERPAA